MPAPDAVDGLEPPVRDMVRVEVGDSLAEMERKVILATLKKTGDNRTKASELLGITARTLRNKLHLYRADGWTEDDVDES